MKLKKLTLVNKLLPFPESTLLNELREHVTAVEKNMVFFINISDLNVEILTKNRILQVHNLVYFKHGLRTNFEEPRKLNKTRVSLAINFSMIRINY